MTDKNEPRRDQFSARDRELAGKVASALEDAFEWRDSKYGAAYWGEVATRLWDIADGTERVQP